MPYFTDSFWSPDFKEAIQTLFEGLFQNCQQNELFITFFANKMELEVMSAKKMISSSNDLVKKCESLVPNGKSGSRIKHDNRNDDLNANSGYQTLIVLNQDLRIQGSQLLEIAELIETSVLQPFTKWCKEHKQRLEYSEKLLNDNITNFHKFKGNLTNKLEQQYINKCKLLQDFKTELPQHMIEEMDQILTQWKIWNKFLDKEKEYTHYTTLCNGSIDVDIRTMKMILRSLLLDLKKEDYKTSVFGYLITNTNNGYDIAQWLTQIMSLNNVKQAELIGQELINLNFLKDCNHNLSLKKAQFSSSKDLQYQWKPTAFDFIDIDPETLKGKIDEYNVPDFVTNTSKLSINEMESKKEITKNSVSETQDKAENKISNNDGLVVQTNESIGSTENNEKENVDGKQNAETQHDFDLDLDDDDFERVSIEVKSKNEKDQEKQESADLGTSKNAGTTTAKSDTIENDESGSTFVDEDLQPPPQQPKRSLTELEIRYERILNDVKLANWKYLEGVEKADKLRCSLEELILDHLVFMEKCERDRLYALKRATDDLIHCYESKGQLMTLPTTNFKIEPELDLKNFVLKYRVGVYQPMPIIYRNYFGGGDPMMDKQVFGIDLTVRCRLDHSKVPKIISKILQHFDDNVYPELPNDEVRCSIWTKSVKLSHSHELRLKLNDSFKLAKFQLNDIEPSIVASVLKIYLLELPIPLIPQELNDILKKIYHITDNNEDEDSVVKSNEKFHAIANVLSRIPKLHLATLDAISTHFVRLLSIIETSEENKDLSKKFIELISQEFANCIIRLTSFNDNVLGYKIFRDLLANKNQIFDLLKKNIKQINELNN
ncbi:hypothetical protein ACO0QE_003494 [Hanseniaspora vineae]